jgi:hypothetical protein
MKDLVSIDRIIRHSPPSILDQLPKGTLCEVATITPDPLEIYEQRSDDSSHPQWVKIFPLT